MDMGKAAHMSKRSTSTCCPPQTCSRPKRAVRAVKNKVVTLQSVTPVDSVGCDTWASGRPLGSVWVVGLCVMGGCPYLLRMWLEPYRILEGIILSCDATSPRVFLDFERTPESLSQR